MADCSKALASIDQEYVMLTVRRRQLLADKAGIMFGRVRNVYSDYGGIGDPQPYLYGSFALDTIINPFDPENAYDLDMGVVIGAEETLIYNPETYLKKLKEYLEEHFDTVEYRSHCIRAIYATSEEVPSYNIDISVYRECKGGKQIATKENTWEESDPSLFVEWFKGEVSAKPHLLSLVRIVKWWTQTYRTKMPSGLMFTIWIADNYVHDPRLDVSLSKTLSSIEGRLLTTFQCLRPTYPKGEDIAQNLNQKSKDDMLTRLRIFVDSMEKAIQAASAEDAFTYLNSLFEDSIPRSKLELIKTAMVYEERSINNTLTIGKTGAVNPASGGKPVASAKFYGAKGS